MVKINEKLFEDLYNKGLKDSEIAKELNCNPATIFLWRKRNNLLSNNKIKVNIKNENIQKLFKEGFSRNEISKKLNLNYKSIQSSLIYLNNDRKVNNISAIVGTLLGDAWVNNKNVFGLAHKKEHKEYLLFKGKLIDLPYYLYYKEQYRNSTLCKSFTVNFKPNTYFKILRNILKTNKES